jgi:hypothetical protein
MAMWGVSVKFKLADWITRWQGQGGILKISRDIPYRAAIERWWKRPASVW